MHADPLMHVQGVVQGATKKQPHREVGVGLALHSVGTAGFEPATP